LLNSNFSIAPYKVAAIQFAARHGEKDANISALADLVEEAGSNGARLIVLPEMAVTGYCWNDRAEIAPFVETIPGPTTQTVEAIASRHRCYIAIGLPEVDPSTDLYYNSMALVGPDGVIGSYRKTHANIAEPRWARDGKDALPVWSTELGNIAGLICMDLCYFETTRIAALQGGDVVAFPSCWMDIKAPSPLWISAAYENGVYIVAADSWGSERGMQFSGGSCIIDPDGTVQSRIDSGNGITYGEVDVARARDKKIAGEIDRFADRRPDQYLRLVQNTYLWPGKQFHGLYGHAPLPTAGRSKVGVVQCEPGFADLAKNAASIENLLRQSEEDVQLVVLPELAVCHFTNRLQNRASVSEEAEDILCFLAKRFDLYLVTSIPEGENDVWYHSAVLVGPDGVIGRYRKVHLSATDREWAQPGNCGFPTFDLDIGRVGLLVGCDLLFPEAAMSLAVWGCDLICVPAALEYPLPIGLGATEIPFSAPIPKGADPVHFLLWRVRAEQVNTYLAISNYCGAEFAGYSGIFSPELEVFPRRETFVKGGEAGVCSLVMDLGDERSAARRKDMLGMRQVHLYDKLVERSGILGGSVDEEE
jgi:predicted amidohydrolase